MALRWLPKVVGLAILAAMLAAMLVLASGTGPAAAQDANALWRTNVTTCSATNRPACDRAVTLADQLFVRIDRNVAVTWMQACLAGDTDRCEIGYRRFKSTSFADDPQPISHMFARASCFAGIADLCRPWDDFDTVDEDKRALVMAQVCMQGGHADTCYRALAHFKDRKGLYNPVTYDLSNLLCERYKSGSACRVWAEALEANWDHRRAYRYHASACKTGLQASCPDAARLKMRINLEDRQRAAAQEAEQNRLRATQSASAARAQLGASGYDYGRYDGKSETPFGSSPRDIGNWSQYQKYMCRLASTAALC